MLPRITKSIGQDSSHTYKVKSKKQSGDALRLCITMLPISPHSDYYVEEFKFDIILIFFKRTIKN